MKNKKTVIVLSILTMIVTIMGGTLAYFSWATSESQKTNVTFTVTPNFSCAADGGGSINNTNATIAPASCTNSKYAIQREVTVTPTIDKDGLSIYMDLWLNVNTLGSGLSKSQNFNYALTTESNNCTDGVIASGNFNGKTTGDTVALLNQETYSSETPQTYYLYIWLDAKEESKETMDQDFNLTLGGSCSDLEYPEPATPDLDDGMVPVVISNDGTVTTVSSSDDNWYNYNNRKWANVVLVNKDATSGVTGSKSRSYYLSNPGTEVAEEDILAYYVWIPRYSYRIPGIKCSTIEGVNVTDYPGCYSIKLNNPDDKTSLIQGVYGLALQQGFTSYTIADATKEVEEGLESGIINSPTLGFENAPMSGAMELYNSMAPTSIGYTTELQPNREIQTSDEKTIDIKFETSTSKKLTGDAVNTYRTHPAFTFGTNKELNGIWIGKFETSTKNTTSCYTNASIDNCNNANQEPRILPNVASLRYQQVSNQFQTSLKFAGGTLSNGVVTFNNNNIYGLTTEYDSHMMKNSEWGAVAYLSHSNYGINDEIRINNYYNSSDYYYKTGCGALTENEYDSATCGIRYGSGVASYPQSTTGNISGVFDMSGGVYEYTMGVLADTEGAPRSGNSETSNSGFNGALGSGSLTTGIKFPNSKYYDLYTVTSMNSCTLEECGGHALYETANWYSDYAYFVFSSRPWFLRGGGNDGGSRAGAFYSFNDGGYGYSNYGFRSAVIKGA